MSSPAPAEPGDLEGLSPAEQAVLTILATYLATRTAVAAVRLPADLVNRLTSIGLSRRAVTTAGRMVLEPPLTGRNRAGSPKPSRLRSQSMARRIAANEPYMRARYLLAAARRLTQSMLDRDFPAALARERRYLDAHRAAGMRRARAARAYDKVAARSEFLRWQTHPGVHTDSVCGDMAGHVWHISKPPFPPPGAVHPQCRCEAVPAF